MDYSSNYAQEVQNFKTILLIEEETCDFQLLTGKKVINAPLPVIGLFLPTDIPYFKQLFYQTQIASFVHLTKIHLELLIIVLRECI